MASFSAKDYAGSQIYFMVGSGTGSAGDPFIQTISMAASSAVIGGVTQSGTWNVGTVTNLAQMAGQAIAMGTGVRTTGTQRVTIATDDSVSVTGTFWQATQPISAIALPLPNGAATELTLSSIETKVVACNTGAVVLAAGTATFGKLGSNSGVTIGAVELAAAQTLATVTNLSQMGGQSIAMGSGIRTAGTQRITIATDDSVQVTGTFWQATQPVSLAVLPALAAGTNAIGKLAANSGVDIGDVDVTSLPALAAGTNTIGSVGDVATTTGGTTGYSVISTAAVLAAQVKGSAGNVYSIQAFNTNASPRYVRLYDQTGAPGSGDAANIVWRGTVPGNTAAGGFNIPLGGSKGIACGTGIGIRASAAIADNDTTVLAANELIFNVQYK